MTSSSFNCWHLLRGPDFSNEATSPAQPLANPNDCHDNLIALLATAQKHQVDLLSITSQPARGPLGIGASATVNQSTANLSMDLSLAFKNFVPENASGSRNRLYRSMIQEILILRQPAIYKARNIIDLWGISWDVHLQTNSIRPVFVYRKGGLGTIAEFFRKGPGQDYSVHEKLKLCEGIAVGLSFLHHKGVVHGDIKPENIIVFKEADYDDEIVPKLSDFTFSVIGRSASSLVQLPSSQPWTAPEYHSRMHSFAAATCMDVFSYGMVCFWILFKGFLFHDLPVKEELKSLKILKDEVRLVEVACKSVDSLEIDEDHRLQLRAFFDSTLATDPSQRRQYASPEMPLLPHDFVDLYDIDLFPDDADGHLTFHLADSLRQLSMVDFRVREGIFKALESNFSSACQTCTSSTVVQLSLCLHLGFGVGRDVKKRDLLLSDSALSQREFEVELNRVEHLKLERSMVTLLELADDDFLHEYQSRGDMVEAVSHYEREIAARQQVFPGTHLLVTVLKCILAHIYEAVGRRDEGTALFKAIYDAHLTEFGPDDAETLLAKVNLLNSYNETGKSSLALSEGEKLVPICQKVFGDDDPWATTCMANLAMSYYHQEQYELAIRVLKEATALFEKVLGQEHLYTMAAMGNLALVYMDKNPQEAEEALAVMMEVVRRRLQSTGQSHRHSISSEAALALALKRTGTDLTEVASIQRRIVEETQSLHTAGGPDVWIAKINYALTLGDLGDWEKAKPLFEESLLKLGLILGSTHPLYLRALRESGRRYEKNKDDVGAVSLWQRALGLASEGSEIFIDTAHDLAVKYYELEEYESASELWTQIIEVGRQRDGPIHPNVLAAMSWLGSHFIENGQFVKGQSLLFECYQGYEATHGDYHVETLKARHEIGRSYILTSQFANAEEVHTKLMEANQKALPASHDLIHTNMESLAEVYRRQNRYKQALRLDQEVLLLRKSILGWENEDTINSMFFVARDLKETGDMALAEALCRETLELRRKTGGKMAPKSLIVERELLTILTAQKKFEEAEVLAKQHSEDCKGEYGSLHEESLEGLYWLAYTMSDIGKHSEAQLHAKEALDGCLKLLGPGNADTIAALGLLGVALRDDGQVDEAISKFELELSWSESLPEEERRFRSVRAMEHLISAYAIQGIGDKVKGLEERIAKMRPEPWPCTEVEDGLRKIVNLYLEAPAGDLGLHG